jgi:hypothetical protein
MSQASSETASTKYLKAVGSCFAATNSCSSLEPTNRGLGFDVFLASYLDEAGLDDNTTPEPEPGNGTFANIYELAG